MTRNIKGILLGLLLSALSSAPAYAATYTAASCSTSAVQAAINSAAGGRPAVTIPALLADELDVNRDGHKGDNPPRRRRRADHLRG